MSFTIQVFDYGGDNCLEITDDAGPVGPIVRVTISGTNFYKKGMAVEVNYWELRQGLDFFGSIFEPKEIK